MKIGYSPEPLRNHLDQKIFFLIVHCGSLNYRPSTRLSALDCSTTRVQMSDLADC